MQTLIASDLWVRLGSLFDMDKPVLIDTGDGIFKIDRVEEDVHEVIIHLGEMP